MSYAYGHAYGPSSDFASGPSVGDNGPYASPNSGEEYCVYSSPHGSALSGFSDPHSPRGYSPHYGGSPSGYMSPADEPPPHREYGALVPWNGEAYYDAYCGEEQPSQEPYTGEFRGYDLDAYGDPCGFGYQSARHSPLGPVYSPPTDEGLCDPYHSGEVAHMYHAATSDPQWSEQLARVCYFEMKSASPIYTEARVATHTYAPSASYGQGPFPQGPDCGPIYAQADHKTRMAEAAEHTRFVEEQRALAALARLAEAQRKTAARAQFAEEQRKEAESAARWKKHSEDAAEFRRAAHKGMKELQEQIGAYKLQLRREEEAAAWKKLRKEIADVVSQLRKEEAAKRSKEVLSREDLVAEQPQPQLTPLVEEVAQELNSRTNSLEGEGHDVILAPRLLPSSGPCPAHGPYVAQLPAVALFELPEAPQPASDPVPHRLQTPLCAPAPYGRHPASHGHHCTIAWLYRTHYRTPRYRRLIVRGLGRSAARGPYRPPPTRPSPRSWTRALYRSPRPPDV